MKMEPKGNYKIFIKDENDNCAVCIRRVDSGLLARFDCIYSAEVYARAVGLKSGYIIKK